MINSDEEKIIENIEYIKNEIERLQKEIEQFKSENKVSKLFDEIEKEINDPEILIGSIIYLTDETIKFISKTPEGKYGNLIIYNNKGYFHDWRTFAIENKNVKINVLHQYDISDKIINIIKTLQESPLDKVNSDLVKLYYFLKKGYKLTLFKY